MKRKIRARKQNGGPQRLLLVVHKDQPVRQNPEKISPRRQTIPMSHTRTKGRQYVGLVDHDKRARCRCVTVDLVSPKTNNYPVRRARGKKKLTNKIITFGARGSSPILAVIERPNEKRSTNCNGNYTGGGEKQMDFGGFRSQIIISIR